MAQVRPIHALAASLLHKPERELDLIEITRLTCMERDLAMDEAATAVIAAKAARDECQVLRAALQLERSKPKKNKRHGQPKESDVKTISEIDGLLNLLNEQFSLDITAIELKKIIKNRFAMSPISNQESLIDDTSCRNSINSKLNNQLLELQQRCDELNQANYNLRDQLDSQTVRFNEEKQKLETALSELEQQNVALMEEIASLVKGANIQSVRIESLTTELIEARTELENAKLYHMNQIQAKNSKAMKDLEAKIEKERIEYNARASHDAVELADARHLLKSRNEDVIRLQTEIDIANRNIESLQEAWHNERDASIHWQNELYKKAQDLESFASSSRAEADDMKNKLSSLECERDLLRVQLDDCQQQLSKREMENMQVEGKYANVEAELNQARATIEEKEEATSILTAQLAMHIRHWKRHLPVNMA
ncbi:hypothetical protein Ae201684P_000633 [Aphanomyces euteiches]|uniref:Uncharacterized protein n=1 Tax=Aphanomyces euteiches TaxID=100861 RepID=A0A6G0XQV7_9STRA|nr:hypothetical protein Ae201684_002308 [Aphanomyces euteiches]KAH9087222.1 hypothetical protein Ae201684P_000633 [Aphanomyces euteiches]KAH9150754.1 hypothetical protein AeRB84_006465 [Aphanomyces euteiches]